MAGLGQEKLQKRVVSRGGLDQFMHLFKCYAIISGLRRAGGRGIGLVSCVIHYFDLK